MLINCQVSLSTDIVTTQLIIEDVQMFSGETSGLLPLCHHTTLPWDESSHRTVLLHTQNLQQDFENAAEYNMTKIQN